MPLRHLVIDRYLGCLQFQPLYFLEHGLLHDVDGRIFPGVQLDLSTRLVHQHAGAGHGAWTWVDAHVSGMKHGRKKVAVRVCVYIEGVREVKY